MFEAGSIIWRIQVVGKDVLKQDLNESEQAANRAGTALDKTGKNTEDLGKKSQTAAPKVRDISQATATVGRTLVVVGAAMAAIGAAVAKTGIEYNTLQQTSRAALTTLLGSAKDANAQMDKLDEFARTSPFAKDVFIKAQQQMLAFGIESKKVVPYLDAIQNAVAAAGGSNEDLAAITAAMSKIQSSAKITAEDLNVFGNSGVNAAELIGSQMGMTGAQIREEITAGSLDATEALDALAEGMATNFAGASANVKKTFAGATDNMKASWRDFSADLMTPLVDPNGGGALIDLLNWTADMMRGFMDLPKPVKDTTTALVLVIGATALFGGAALLAIPKIVAFRLAVKTLGEQMPKTTAGLKSFVRFLKGPGGIALAAAVVGFTLLVKHIESVSASAEEMTASIEGSGTAIDIMATHIRGVATSADGVSEATAQIKNLDLALRQTSEAGYQSGQPGVSRIYDQITTSVKLVGETLGELANTDLPAAQDGFSELADKTDGTDKRLLQLLNTMPAYKDALIVQATAAGTYAATMSEAEKNTILLELAQGDGEKATKSAADAYVEAADEAQGLQDNLDALIDTINKANGVGQDAVSANANYQAALADSTAEVDAFTKANDASVDALDSNTAAGSANMEMLSGLAQDGQAAAEAQFELDLKTMGAKEATEKYQQTLKDGQQAVLDRAIALGANDEQLKFIREHIADIPPDKTFKMIVDDIQANRRMENWIAKWDGTSTVGVRVHPFAMGVNQADGGKVNFYGDGGRENHIAQFARAGTMRVWAEPETGGEWYIPAAKSKRQRSTQVLAAAAEEFGYSLTPQGGNDSATAQVVGGSTPRGRQESEPTVLSDESIEKLARTMTSYLRPMTRQG